MRRCPPRDSRRSSAQVAIAAASGRGRRPAAPSRSASRSGPARRQTASRVASVGGSNRQPPRLGAARGRRLLRAPPRRRGAEDEALAERVRGEPVGAVQAGAGALADRVEPGQRGAAVEVDRDPAHHVVGGRGDRDRLAARVEAGLGERGEDVGEAGRVERRAGRASPPRSPSASSRSRIAAVTASRGASSSVKRSPAASSRVAPSPRIASVIRSPSAGARQRQGGRVELAELEVGELGAGGCGQHRPGADRPPGVGRPAPERRGAAGREHGRRRGDRAAVGDHAVAALAVAPERQRRGPLADLDPRSRRRPSPPASR